MKLRMIGGGGCSGDNCPTVYVTDRGTAVIQGYVVDDGDALATLSLPAGESAVEIPLDVLRAAADGV